ncbi:MAG: hypothetical protein IJ446_10455 [Oscillospiraceae bacterium]|nr:hypothetical protein [Oscillospiraceae bacterium]
MELLKENERSANKAAAKVMRITVLVFAVILILDIAGIFVVPLNVMITSYLIGTVLLFVPTFIVNFAKKDGPWVKYAIVLCAVLFTVDVAITLSYHAILLFVYPIAIASLYFSGGLNIFAAVITVIGVSLGQFLAFKLNYVTDDNFTELKSVILFGILPRAMILFAISSIFTMLCKRTASMLGSLMGAEQQRIMREKSLEVSEKLLETVSELDKISAAAADANRSIADESENVMRDSTANTEHIKSVEDNMNIISDNLKDLSDMSRSIAELAGRADEITADNNEKMAAASMSMDEICKGTDESKEIISRLSQQSDKIVEIANVITDISMQTNILALNAAVEAAHAGEQGKGFAVVADEIKKLSEQTQSAAAEIGIIIEQVTQNIAGTVDAMEKNAVLTRDGMDSMNKMRISAEQISRSNAEISRHINDMNRVISEVAANGENVSRKLESVSGNIQNNCAAVQHVAAAIEENSAGTENLGYMVRDILVMSEELERLTK